MGERGPRSTPARVTLPTEQGAAMRRRGRLGGRMGERSLPPRRSHARLWRRRLPAGPFIGCPCRPPGCPIGFLQTRARHDQLMGGPWIPAIGPAKTGRRGREGERRAGLAERKTRASSCWAGGSAFSSGERKTSSGQQRAENEPPAPAAAHWLLCAGLGPSAGACSRGGACWSPAGRSRERCGPGLPVPRFKTKEAPQSQRPWASAGAAAQGRCGSGFAL